MSFIVFGPGVSDPVSLEQATTQGLLRFSGHSEPTEPVSMDEAAIRNRGTGEGSAGGGGAARGSGANAYASVATQNREQRETGPVQLAHQIMSQPVYTLPADATVSQVRALFERHRISLVPILDANEHIVGVVSRWFLARQELPWAKLAQQPVRSVARSPVLTAGQNTSIRELAKALLEQNIHGMPVVDGQHRVVGVVTRSDILRALINYAPLELWL